MNKFSDYVTDELLRWRKAYPSERKFINYYLGNITIDDDESEALSRALELVPDLVGEELEECDFNVTEDDLDKIVFDHYEGLWGSPFDDEEEKNLFMIYENALYAFKNKEELVYYHS